MKGFHEGFVGNQIANTTLAFSGGDTEETFNKNLKTQPIDWYYRTHQISYSYNSLGHRCKNIEDIDLSNYILFAGCSHTEGIGLELENTYPYQVAELLGCDYYNLGLGGASIDLMMHNLVMWNNKVSAKPKALVILWPHHVRFMTIDNDTVKTHFPSDSSESTARFITLGEEVGFFESRKTASKVIISTLYDGCKVINASWNRCPKDFPLSLNTKDFARDLGHSGIKSNKIFAKEIAELLR